MSARRFVVPSAFLLLSAALAAQPPTGGGRDSIQPAALEEWLSYIASDELQGRQVYTEGLGLAAAYIADHLKAWGVKPAGEDGTYFQTVKVVGVQTASRASVTVTVNGRSRTFKDGEGVSFPKNMGGRQTVTSTDVVFAGYGLQIPGNGIDDYKDLDARGKVIVWLGADGPAGVGNSSRRLLFARSRLAAEKGAVAVIAPAVAPGGRGRGGAAGRGQQPAGPGAGRGQVTPDFTTVQRYDAPTPPTVTVDDEFLEFLFSGASPSYADLAALAGKREPLPHITLADVSLRFDVDADYTPVTTRLTRNVVGIVEGSDPQLKDTYVMFGAHYDHIGYSQAPPAAGRGGGFGGGAPGGCEGQTRDTPKPGDVINNGADEDGSGTVALMALARAYAEGPTPKRSLLFVWHAGEEAGLLGSRYMADYPIVPLDTVAAQLNIDMIGRNRCDDPSQADTVYLIGSDRISTELHNLSEDANDALSKPLTLDYELNDPADPESLYTRSDHYSYAAKGIPIIFYFTGLHRDYHYLTDEVDKIQFDKMSRIARLVYETSWRVANLDHVPKRDNLGPRMGKGSKGRVDGTAK